MANKSDTKIPAWLRDRARRWRRSRRTALGLLSRLSIKTGEDSVENGQFCLFDG
jgi:hypothetical protein